MLRRAVAAQDVGSVGVWRVHAVCACGRGADGIDACRMAVRMGAEIVPLTRRPVLFGIARALAEAVLG